MTEPNSILWVLTIAVNLGFVLGEVNADLAYGEQLSLKALIVIIMFSIILAPVATLVFVGQTILEALNSKGRIFKDPSGLNIRN